MELKKVTDQNELVPTSEYEYAKFPFEHFNPVQSRIFDFFREDCNSIIASSTASGKTASAEMFMSYVVRQLGKKAMFLAPMKALSQEKYDDWTSKEHHFSDLKVVICTGDYRLTAGRKKEMDEADILIMTSEMLNSCSRNYNSDKNEFLDSVGIVVCDEAHSICMTDRGSHIESGLMKFTEYNPNARIVLLSATMPNVSEMGGWLCSLNKKKTYVLESKFRPTKLNIHFKTYNDDGSYLIVELNKIKAAITIVEKNYADSFLLFVHTKRTGEMLVEELQKSGIKSEFHSADLTKEKRIEIEENFKTGKLRCLVATSTLAWGCYQKGTPVLMADNTLKSIEDIKVGEEVFSMSSNGFVPKPVLRVGPKNSSECLEVSLDDGKTTVVSEDHIFYGNIENVNYHSVLKYKIGDSIAVCDKGIEFSKIKSIKKINKPVELWDIEVKDLHNYVGGGMVSHNCNLPARRVIILGVHRGLSVVETYDIMQEVGRAGRPKYDPEGDAYILLPSKTFAEQKQRILNQGDIESQLMEPKTLAFHIISEVHHKGIESHEDVDTWFNRSFARYQDNKLDDDLSEQVINRLKKSGSVYEADDGKFDITPVGKISSMFYFSPFDVADLSRNLNNLFENCDEGNDHLLCYALANVDSNRNGITNVAERDEMSKFKKVMIEFLNPKQQEFFTDGICKIAYSYFLAITGTNPGAFSAMVRAIKVDFSRLKDVLTALDGMVGKWDQSEYFKRLELRITYGVREELLDLCKIKGIGGIKAQRLYDHGLKNLKEVALNMPKVITALNCSKKVAEEVCDEARKLHIVGG